MLGVKSFGCKLLFRSSLVFNPLFLQVEWWG